MYHNGLIKHYSSWENLNDILFLWVNVFQVIFKGIYFRDGKRIIPDWRTSEESFHDGSSGLTGGKIDKAIELDTISLER